MNKAELKSFGTPDEVREFSKGRLELISAWGRCFPTVRRTAPADAHPESPCGAPGSRRSALRRDLRHADSMSRGLTI